MKSITLNISSVFRLSMKALIGDLSVNMSTLSILSEDVAIEGFYCKKFFLRNVHQVNVSADHLKDLIFGVTDFCTIKKLKILLK